MDTAVLVETLRGGGASTPKLRQGPSQAAGAAEDPARGNQLLRPFLHLLGHRGTVGKLIYEDSLYTSALTTISNLQTTGDEIKVTIATLACLLLLGIEHDYFSSFGRRIVERIHTT